MSDPGPLVSALRATVAGRPEKDLASVLAGLGPDPRGEDRFWAAAVHLFGVPSRLRPGHFLVQRDAKRAESLLAESFADEGAGKDCPDCATLWGFLRLHERVPAPASGSPVALVAAAQGFGEAGAAYAIASAHGGALGQLSLAEIVVRGSAPPWHQAALRPDYRGSGNNSAVGRTNCLQALDMTMPVASASMAHESTIVPQPVDLDYLALSRRDDRHTYALAAQLADDGNADGLAAKAEMVFYGKDQVVPGGHASSHLEIACVAVAAAVGFMLTVKSCRLMRRCCRSMPVLPARSTADAAVAAAPASIAQTADAPLPDDPPRPLLCRAALFALASTLAWWWLALASQPLQALEQDEVVAGALFEEAAAAGHWGSAYALAMIKLDGQNKSEAEPWLRQAIEEAEDPSVRAMAEHFQHRHGLGGQAADARRAGELLSEAAMLGDPTAALLLAEAHTKEPGTASDIEPPGGRNMTRALELYRRAASAGRLPTRYNIGVVLLKLHGQGVENISLPACEEILAEFGEVATDLDPTARLLSALAQRAWELGDHEGALAAFMLLSEAGSGKAHRSAALLWEEVPADARGSLSAGEVAAGAAASPPPATCARPASPMQDTFHQVHLGHYCCPSGDCKDPGWILNEASFADPVQCVMSCGANADCNFVTLYDTGYCQHSARCTVKAPAADASAQTYARRPAPPSDEVCSGATPADGEPGEAPCWPWQPGLKSRRCAAAFRARAARFRGAEGMPLGSAAASGREEAEASTLSLVGHLQQLELFDIAHAWACRLGRHSHDGRILCASMEVEAWPGHPRNLTGALDGLWHLNNSTDPGLQFASGVAAASASLRFLVGAAKECHLGLAGIRCPSFDATAQHWGLVGFAQKSFEQLLCALLAAGMGLTLLALLLVLCAWRP